MINVKDSLRLLKLLENKVLIIKRNTQECVQFKENSLSDRKLQI